MLHARTSNRDADAIEVGDDRDDPKEEEQFVPEFQ
jgi:hypothetical protein